MFPTISRQFFHCFFNKDKDKVDKNELDRDKVDKDKVNKDNVNKVDKMDKEDKGKEGSWDAFFYFYCIFKHNTYVLL